MIKTTKKFQLIAFGVPTICAFLVLPDSVLAQFTDSPNDAVQGFNGIEGYWGGYVLCQTRGWAVFHHIQVYSGRTSSEYLYFGGSSGTAPVDIFGSGSSFLFDAQVPNVYDYEYTIADEELIGVGRGEACTSRLHRIPQEVFEDVK